ncbi:hypothetical protein QQ045_006252 [Rhodiola kirilowii]
MLLPVCIGLFLVCGTAVVAGTFDCGSGSGGWGICVGSCWCEDVRFCTGTSSESLYGACEAMFIVGQGSEQDSQGTIEGQEQDIE